MVGSSTACCSLDHLCICLPSFRAACPSTERPCHTFNSTSATTPLLRGEVLLSVKESQILEKSKRINHYLVDEWSRSEYSSNLSKCQQPHVSHCHSSAYIASPVPETSSTGGASLMSRVSLELINPFTHELKVNTNPFPLP